MDFIQKFFALAWPAPAWPGDQEQEGGEIVPDQGLAQRKINTLEINPDHPTFDLLHLLSSVITF